jgi:UDP-N-acetyl-D-glucosamine dehydrogenase
MNDALESRIANRSAAICVIGLGYVGLPLAVELARVGFHVTGLDTNASRVDALANGKSYIGDISDSDLQAALAEGHLVATIDYSVLSGADAMFICVPTPFTPARAPDLSFVLNAARGIARHLHKGQLIVLQSTTYPGTTEDEVLPILESSGLKAGADFHLAFSPERINPGDRQHTVRSTPKVVGGLTPRCAELAASLLAQLHPDVRIVSSPRTAEMTKLLENIFRSVNIALVNEMALLCERMGIDVWEVIEAASTKPFGFMPFYPGPGVGGHCIPVDPYYLLWKAREYEFHTKFIELAAEVNQAMPYHVVDTVCDALNARGKAAQGAKVILLGVAFKKDVDDARNSPAERIAELLRERGADLTYNDPKVPTFAIGGNALRKEQVVLESQPLTADLVAGADCVVILAAHSAYDVAWLVARAALVVDTVNATKDVRNETRNVVRIGAPGGSSGGMSYG